MRWCVGRERGRGIEMILCFVDCRVVVVMCDLDFGDFDCHVEISRGTAQRDELTTTTHSHSDVCGTDC
jgi:hypothetical protein